MIRVIHNAARHQYEPAMFELLGGQPEQLTRAQLLQRLINYVRARSLANYDVIGGGKAWLDTTDTGLRTLLGMQDCAERYVLWDSGQLIAGWREIVAAVHERWVLNQGDG